MAIQKGKDLLLKIDPGSGAYVTVAGLRSRQIAFNAETVDVTHAESAGQWRELLSAASLKRASLSGSGLFKDEASDVAVREAFFLGLARAWRVVIPDFGTVEGPFQVTSLEYSGTERGELAFEITLESAGALNFAAAA